MTTKVDRRGTSVKSRSDRTSNKSGVGGTVEGTGGSDIKRYCCYKTDTESIMIDVKHLTVHY